MEKDNNYNAMLDKLFVQWKNSYDETDWKRFCEDGIMLKADDSINVDREWESASRRILFLLKDNPDGGHDTRLWLRDKNNGDNNRNLRTIFIKRIAQAYYGLLYCNHGNIDEINHSVINSRKKTGLVKRTWNERPFAFVEAKKLSGGKTVSENQLNRALQRDAKFLKEEFDILSPNVIVCCDNTGDSLFDFVTTCYLNNKCFQPYGGEYILENDWVVPNLTTCLRYYPDDRIVVIKSYHPSARVGWKFLEKIFSPYRAFIREHPDF